MGELTYVTSSRPRKKAGPTARYRAKRKRADDAVAAVIRAKCVLRDGYCKFAILGGCRGASQHCHLGQWKRARTRGQAPVRRHTLEGSCMACEFHHEAEEHGAMKVTMFADLGANGPIRTEFRGRVVVIP